MSRLQAEAEANGKASWGHWGEQPDRYAAWSNHSNRLIPVYTFGIGLESVSGTHSPYRDARRLEALYGRVPERTLDPDADYFDQTDVARLQRFAAEAGKKIIVLVVFDGMDWHTTRTAAIATTGTEAYDSGRGTGVAFQDYRGAPTDFGWCVTSPANDGTQVDVDAQAVRNPGGETPGGYDPTRGGATPWDPRCDLRYLIGRDRDCRHAVTDSAASATELCTGRKTYNDAINVGPDGAELVPLARRLQTRGWAGGAVASVPGSHATPACADAKTGRRDDYQDIARDQLGEPSILHRDPPLPGLDVLVGAGFGVAGDAVKDKDQGRNFEPGNSTWPIRPAGRSTCDTAAATAWPSGRPAAAVPTCSPRRPATPSPAGCGCSGSSAWPRGSCRSARPTATSIPPVFPTSVRKPPRCGRSTAATSAIRRPTAPRTPRSPTWPWRRSTCSPAAGRSG
ncbi:MAG: alkaline phosphatase [Planctomycetia bacterium]